MKSMHRRRVRRLRGCPWPPCAAAPVAALWAAAGLTKTWLTGRRFTSDRLTRPLLTAGVLTAVLVTGGCGYRHKPIFPEDVGTVAVEAFENQAYYNRGVEFFLTEAVKKEIEWRTPYKVTRAEGADTVLTGEIVQISQTTLSRRRGGGLPQDVEYRVIVNFEWKDMRSGDVLRQRRGMEVVAPYGPARQIGETQTLGQHRAVQRVAERVVSVMMADM